MKYLILLLVIVAGCDTLEVQENYCEVAFAYPVDEPLPEVMNKNLIGCSCSSKDVLAGRVVTGWELRPLENCRRIRGFNPKQWAKPIDSYLQEKVAKKLAKARKK